MESLDPYQRPPDGIRNVYKKYQKMKRQDLSQDPEIVDLGRDSSDSQKGNVSIVKMLDPQHLTATFQRFSQTANLECSTEEVPVYKHLDMPGLHIIPNLLPPEIQTLLLSRLLHRDLSTPTHLTNIHTHYNLSYPTTPNPSFFSLPPTTPHAIATPLDPTIHKPLTITQLLNKKMRWMTLGGQYDWTLKRYPDSEPPAFPPDIKEMLESIFDNTKAEAAIVNLYSPGDTLSVHRDVAESCNTGLISISLGCDAIFIIGTADEKILALRLRSGSAVYMSGESRFAWHGVPQIVPNTCPVYLREWPDGGDEEAFGRWKGWMGTKRVNLNVRQMWDS